MKEIKPKGTVEVSPAPKVSASPVKAFVIDRAKWVNADTTRFASNPTSLLNPAGNMCCLGFWGKACGIPDAEMLSRWCPDDLIVEHRRHYEVLADYVQSLISINDNHEIDSIQREEILTKLFAERGIEVTFVGEYPSLDGDKVTA